MRTGIVIVILAIIALAYFNPGMDEFKLFVQQQSEVLVQQEAGGGTVGDFLAGAAGRLAGQHVERVTDRTNYVIFSTYTIDLDGPDSENNEWRFVGIAGQFFESHRPESLRQE